MVIGWKRNPEDGSWNVVPGTIEYGLVYIIKRVGRAFQLVCGGELVGKPQTLRKCKALAEKTRREADKKLPYKLDGVSDVEPVPSIKISHKRAEEILLTLTGEQAINTFVHKPELGFNDYKSVEKTGKSIKDGRSFKGLPADQIEELARVNGFTLAEILEEVDRWLDAEQEVRAEQLAKRKFRSFAEDGAGTVFGEKVRLMEHREDNDPNDLGSVGNNQPPPDEPDQYIVEAEQAQPPHLKRYKNNQDGLYVTSDLASARVYCREAYAEKAAEKLRSRKDLRNVRVVPRTVRELKELQLMPGVAGPVNGGRKPRNDNSKFFRKDHSHGERERHY